MPNKASESLGSQGMRQHYTDMLREGFERFVKDNPVVDLMFLSDVLFLEQGDGEELFADRVLRYMNFDTSAPPTPEDSARQPVSFDPVRRTRKRTEFRPGDQERI
jgi:hypothetical protein